MIGEVGPTCSRRTTLGSLIAGRVTATGVSLSHAYACRLRPVERDSAISRPDHAAGPMADGSMSQRRVQRVLRSAETGHWRAQRPAAALRLPPSFQTPATSD